jgi:hypothetical protein
MYISIKIKLFVQILLVMWVLVVAIITLALAAIKHVS